jgi:hypothetical protein
VRLAVLRSFGTIPRKERRLYRVAVFTPALVDYPSLAVSNSARARRLVTVLATVHLAIFVFLAIQSDVMRSDFERFWLIATAPGRPYADYPVEYPPLTLAVFKAVAALSGTASSFALVLLVLNLAAEAGLVAILASTWGIEAAAFYLATSLPLLPILYYRIDFWPTLAAAAGLASVLRGRAVAGAAAFATGFGLKLWPLVLSVSVLTDEDVRRRWLAMAALVGGCATVLGAWVWVGGPEAVRQVTTFRGARGWSIESVAGSLVHLAGHSTPRTESGAWRIGTISPAVSNALFALTTPLAFGCVYFGVRARRPGAAWIAGVGALILGSALISPQFFVWLLPGAAMAWVEGDQLSALAGAATMVLSTAVLTCYGPLVQGALYAQLLVIARNLACAIGVAGSIRTLLAEGRRRAASSVAYRI